MEIADWRLKTVLGMAILYWSTVGLNALRIYVKSGHFPELGPKSSKENLLWTGWLCVALGWFLHPLMMDENPHWFSGMIIPFFNKPGVTALGCVLGAAGYAATLWCYQALGHAWSLSTTHENQSFVRTGPYKRMRHPVYTFEIIIFAGMLAILPTALFALLWVLLVICIGIKAQDEEIMMQAKYGASYTDYFKKTGRFLPRYGKTQKHL